MKGFGKVGPAMSLRKSPTLTAALLASNRRNAKKSTGPRTARGKAVSRLNRLWDGTRSRDYLRLQRALLNAPMGQVGVVARGLLLSQPVIHPIFMERAMLAVEVENDLIKELQHRYEKRGKNNNTLRHSKPEGY